MNTPLQGVREYRIVDLLQNGAAVLDADDMQPSHHRRIVQARSLPAGAEMGATIRRYDDGRFELVSMLCDPSVCEGEPGHVLSSEAIQISPKFGGLISATVTTIAHEFDLSVLLAAHLMHIWIKVEYLL